MQNSIEVQCSTTETTLQIKFLKTPASSVRTLRGSTSGQIFQNPFSQRRLRGVTVTLSRDSEVLVTKQTALSSLQLAPMDNFNIKIESSSQLVGFRGATMTLSLKPKTLLKNKGRIIIQTPAWYMKEAVGQEGVQDDFLVESMINSDALITSSQLKVTRTQQDTEKNILMIEYETSRDTTETVYLEVFSFNNPVDMSVKGGFKVTTADQQGFLIDESDNNIILSTQMTIPQTLDEVAIQLLGDNQGMNKGMISTLQTFQLSVVLNFPVEPFCYFVLKFPQTLKLLQNVELVTGSGIFLPSTRSDALSVGSSGQYEVDILQNTIKIEACRLSNYLTENPFGTLTIKSVRMPDYIDQQEPIAFRVYSDQALTSLVVDDPSSAQLKISDITPGLFTVELFRPTNFFASATKVGYTIHVRPMHNLTPESRIIIRMPQLLTFDRTEGCQVILTECKCSLAPDSNTLTLSEIFDQNFKGGTLLKFGIFSATNPLGSQPAGPWSISSETPVNGNFYVVDEQYVQESFFAQSGQILSLLKVDNLQVSSSKAIYSFSIKTEHNIPQGGKLKVTFPSQIQLSDKIKVTGEQQVESIQGNQITFNFVTATDSDQQISFTVSGVKNPRSMQASSAFTVQTTDAQGYIIDGGGQDIIVQCDTLAEFNSISIDNLNKTNGATMRTKLSIGFEHALQVNDTLHVVLPNNIDFAEKVLCEAVQLVTKVSCSHSDKELQIKIADVDGEPGIMIVYVDGIKNPNSFRESLPFQRIYTTDGHGYGSQQVKSAVELTLRTSTTAQVQDFMIVQDTEDYSQIGKVTIQFKTVNPIGSSGIILLKWPGSVKLFSDTFCQVTTHKQIVRQGVCQFDTKARTLRINNAFLEVPPQYFGLIQIILSKVQNPATNENLQNYDIVTYDDPEMFYPIDQLLVPPKLKCLWPCLQCGQQQNYCTSCWQSSTYNYLFMSANQSTCLDRCPKGWSSNGTQPRQCRECDITCDSCQDKGLPYDVSRCLSCASTFPFFEKTERETGICSVKCREGLFGNENKICLKCASTCQTCNLTDTTCTGCHEDTLMDVLLGDKCVSDCPSGFTEVLGICEKCQSPCKTCDGQTHWCSTCDNTLGRKYNFGINCLDQCPLSTVLNEATQQCEGCRTGCSVCSNGNPDKCLKCFEKYLSYGDECVATCPPDSILTLSGKSCRALSELDTRIVYYPLLILMVLCGIISWVGKITKPSHKFLTNFLIMLGMVEHIAMVVQIVLTFIFGSYLMAILIIAIWAAYIGTLIWFNFTWYTQLIKQDVSYDVYRRHSDNIVSTRVRASLAAIVSWRFQKLLYSHFFGAHVNPFRFSNQARLKELILKATISNVVLTFLPLLTLNVYGLLSSPGGVLATQLQISYLENAVIAVISSLLSFVEYKQMVRELIKLDRKHETIQQTNKSLQRRKFMMEIAGMVQNKKRKSELFVQRKLDDLITHFGSRGCKSLSDSEPREHSPRLVRSFPMSPKLAPVAVDDPPRPINQIVINNCYAFSYKILGLTMRQLNGEGINKQFQVGSRLDLDILRSDTYIVSKEEDYDAQHTARKDKKQRGRKSHVTRLIDEQDNRAGAVLDQDEEGSKANYQMRADYLKSIREEDEILKRTRIIQRKHTNSNSTLSSPRRIKNQQKVLLSSLESHSQHRISVDVLRIEHQALRPPKKLSAVPSLQKITPARVVEMPDSGLRNFNEVDIMGCLERSDDGRVIVEQLFEGGYLDLRGRLVNAQGYLLNQQGDIVSAHDPNLVIFSKDSLVEERLPAPFLLERFNFNAFDIFGTFKNYKYKNDVKTCVKQKKPHAGDDLNRQVNIHGFLINSDGSLVDQSEKVLFDTKQLKAGSLLPYLYTWSGSKFQITDVMGCLLRDDKYKLIISQSKKGLVDLGGHLVNEKGYLVNEDGSIVTRKGKVLFKRQELMNGEFPKIFSFSTLEVQAIKGTYQRNEIKRPILTEENGHFYDDNRRMCNRRGYLCDTNGNIVDKSQNILFNSFLVEDGRLPAIIKGIKLIRSDSDSELSQILQQIEDDLNSNQIVDSNAQPLQQTSLSLQENDDSTTRQQKTDQKPYNRTFNNLSPTKLESNEKAMSDHRSSQSPPRDRGKKPQLYRMFKKEYFCETDRQMANAYGGEAVPRIRMIEKRVSSNVRERGKVLRDSSALSPNQMMLSQSIMKAPQLLQSSAFELHSRTRTQLTNFKPLEEDRIQSDRESNVAKSIHNFQRKKTIKKQKEAQQNQPESQEQMNRYMDLFNSQLQSMGDLTKLLQSETDLDNNLSTQQLL